MIIANRHVFWSRPVRCKALHVLCLILAGTFSAAGDSGFDRDAALARAYVQVALDLSSDTTAEASLLSAALEFDPGNSDARYLRARRMLEDGSSIRTAVDELETAVECDAWFLTDPVSAVLLLAEQYDRLMRYNDMWTILNRLSELQRGEGRWYYYAVRSAVQTNRIEDALRIAGEGTRLFPRHEEIKALRAELDPSYRVALVEKLSVSEGPAVSEILLRRLILAGPSEERPPLVKLYSGLGYDDPQIHLLRDFNNDSEDGLDIRFILNEKYLKNMSSFRQAYSLFEQEDRLDEFREFCEDRRLFIAEDRNSDGYEDGVYVLDKAQLVEVRRDPDQDAVYEITIAFNENSELPFRPEKLSLLSQDKNYHFTYGRYPEIIHVKIDSSDADREYSFSESVLNVDAIEYEHLPPFVETHTELIPGETELLDRAYRYVSSDNSASISRDASGAIIREENDQKIRIRTQGDEKYIDRDLDGDGRSEIREIYRDNSLYGVYLDQDGNGISEYLYYPSQGLHAWDWDQDGHIDYQSQNGS